MADANGNIKSLRQLLSQKDDDLRDLRAHAAGCEDDLRRQLQVSKHRTKVLKRMGVPVPCDLAR